MQRLSSSANPYPRATSKITSKSASSELQSHRQRLKGVKESASGRKKKRRLSLSPFEDDRAEAESWSFPTKYSEGLSHFEGDDGEENQLKSSSPVEEDRDYEAPIHPEDHHQRADLKSPVTKRIGKRQISPDSPSEDELMLRPVPSSSAAPTHKATPTPPFDDLAPYALPHCPWDGLSDLQGPIPLSSQNDRQHPHPPPHPEMESNKRRLDPTTAPTDRETEIWNLASKCEINELAKHVVLQKEFMDAQRKDMSRLQAESQARDLQWRNELQKKEKELGRIRKELSVSRAFVEVEDAGDIRSVVEGLKSISEDIDDLTFTIFKTLPQSLESTLITSIHCEALNEHFPTCHQLALSCEATKSTCQDFLLYAIAMIMCYEVQKSFFVPFRPSLEMSEEEDRVTKVVYERIRKTEPQDRAARWRSITYDRCVSSNQENDKAYCTTIATNLVHDLVSLVSLLFPPSSDSPFTTSPSSEVPRLDSPSLSIDLSSFLDDLLNISKKALSWRSKCMKSHLSWDFTPISDPSRHEWSEEGSKDGSAVAVKSFGLVRSRCVRVKDGGSDRVVIETVVEEKVGVVREGELSGASEEEGGEEGGETRDKSKDQKVEEEMKELAEELKGAVGKSQATATEMGVDAEVEFEEEVGTEE